MPGTRNHQTGSHGGGDPNEGQASDATIIATAGLKGLIKVAGFAVLAMIAGYSAGYASASYQDTRNRNAANATAGH